MPRPRPICLAYVPIMQCPIITATTMLSLLLWSLGSVAVRLLYNLGQIFRTILPLSEAPNLLITRSTIALSIISLHVLKGISNVENSIRAPSGQIIRPAVAGNIFVSRYLCDTDFISVRHLTETSATVVHRIGILCFDGRLAVGKHCCVIVVMKLVLFFYYKEKGFFFNSLILLFDI